MHSLFGLALPPIPSSTSVLVASVHSFHGSFLDRSYIDNSTTSYESNTSSVDMAGLQTPVNYSKYLVTRMIVPCQVLVLVLVPPAV